eukprot:6948399-Pyramimonas_sp.AAC.1
MTDQSDTGNPTAGLDTDAVELTVKTSSSHLVTREFGSPADSLWAPCMSVSRSVNEGPGGRRRAARRPMLNIE